MTQPLDLSTKIAEERVATDGVRKLALALHDGELVETVVIPGPRRTTVCVSSQAGCPVACTFCATGRMGLRRNLEPEEIVDQYIRAQAVAAANPESIPNPVENIVFMGMGEPFLNYDAVCEALRRLIRDHGFHSRIITVSTIGIVDRIVPFGEAFPHVRLAVSIHAPDEASRTQLVPVNRRHSLEAILTECRRYNEVIGKRVFLEYVLIAGVNDSEDHARRLGDRIAGLDATVNLIPIHPGGSSGDAPPTRERVDEFWRALKSRFSGHVTFRQSRGLDIDAACGQLVTNSRS